MLAEVVVVVIVVVVEVEFGTVGIETSVSWERTVMVIVAEFYTFPPNHLLAGIANNITSSDAMQGHSNPFPNKYERCPVSQRNQI